MNLVRGSLFLFVLAVVATAPASAKARFEWPDFDALAARHPGTGAVCLLHETREEVVDLKGDDDYGSRSEETWVIAVLDPDKASGWLEWTIAD